MVWNKCLYLAFSNIGFIFKIVDGQCGHLYRFDTFHFYLIDFRIFSKRSNCDYVLSSKFISGIFSVFVFSTCLKSEMAVDHVVAFKYLCVVKLPPFCLVMLFWNYDKNLNLYLSIILSMRYTVCLVLLETHIWIWISCCNHDQRTNDLIMSSWWSKTITF